MATITTNTDIIITSLIFVSLAAAVLLLLWVSTKVLCKCCGYLLFLCFPSWFNKIPWAVEKASEELIEEMNCPSVETGDESLEKYRDVVGDDGKVKGTLRRPRRGNGRWFIPYVLETKEKFPEPADNMNNRRSMAKHLAEIMQRDGVTVKERASVIPVAVEMVFIPTEAVILAKQLRVSAAANAQHDQLSRPWFSSWWDVIRPTKAET